MANLIKIIKTNQVPLEPQIAQFDVLSSCVS